MYAKSYIAFDGSGRLTGARTAQTPLTIVIPATAVACCNTILNTSPNARGLNTGPMI